MGGILPHDYHFVKGQDGKKSNAEARRSAELRGGGRVGWSLLRKGADSSRELQEVEGVHVDEDGGLGDFFGVGVGEGAGEDGGQDGAAGRFQEELEAVFGFEASERGGGGAEHA